MRALTCDLDYQFTMNAPTQPTDQTEIEGSRFEVRGEGTDFIIRTADGAELFVHRFLLHQTSPIFATLLSLPQPVEPELCSHTQPTLVDKQKDGLPTVEVSETKAVWNAILHMLYHFDLPEPSSPYDIRPVLEAARKYELDGITTRLRLTLSHAIYTAAWDPTAVYAVASMYGLADVALQAARATLGTPVHELYTRELRDVPAHVLQRLLAFRWRCQEAARGVAAFSTTTTRTGLYKRIDWLPRTDFTFFECSCGAGAVSCSIMGEGEFKLYAGRTYWKEYMERAEQVLKERPVGVAVKDPGIIMPAMRTAGHCVSCGRRIYLDMMDFTEYLAAAVDVATASVSLSVTLQCRVPHTYVAVDNPGNIKAS